MDKLLTIINTVLANKQRPAVTSITGTTSLRNDLAFDSFDLAELTVRIEDEFGVDVFEDGLVETVGEVLDKIGKN